MDSKHLNEQTRRQALAYMDWFMDNIITDPAIRTLLMKQAARRQVSEQLIQTYVDMVALFRQAISAVRTQQDVMAEYERTAVQAAQNDVAVVRLLRLHMTDKLLDLPPDAHKKTGNDINQTEFIRAVRLVAAYKKAYLSAHPKIKETPIRG